MSFQTLALFQNEMKYFILDMPSLYSRVITGEPSEPAPGKFTHVKICNEIIIACTCIFWDQDMHSLVHVVDFSVIQLSVKGCKI